MSKYIKIADKYFFDDNEIINELNKTIAVVADKEKLANDNSWITNEAIRRRVSYDDICIEIDDEISTLKKYIREYQKYLNKKIIISCIKCAQKIRVKEFSKEALIKCPNCSTALKLTFKGNGKIEVTITEEKEGKSRHGSSENTSTSVNYFEILGASESASFDEVKKAYKILIAKYHPDKVCHLGDEFKVLAENKTKEINHAFGVLKIKYKQQ
jgi:DNA-directed RNA polymerase subunit RPC12/RpoP